MNSRTFDIKMTLETDFYVQGYGDTAEDVQLITMTNQVTSRNDEPISRNHDMLNILQDACIDDVEGETCFRLEFYDKNGTRMTITSTKDDGATEKTGTQQYLYNGHRSLYLVDSDLDFDFGEPTFTYTDDNYTKTVSWTMKRTFVSGLDEAVLAREQTFDGHQMFSMTNQQYYYYWSPANIEFTY